MLPGAVRSLAELASRESNEERRLHERDRRSSPPRQPRRLEPEPVVHSADRILEDDVRGRKRQSAVMGSHCSIAGPSSRPPTGKSWMAGSSPAMRERGEASSGPIAYCLLPIAFT